MKINYTPIGVIHSPFTETSGMPLQPSGATGVQGTVEIFDEYAAGLQDLEGFSHIMLLYHFHRSKESTLLVRPFLDRQLRGVFATRAPRRPNSIGFSVVKLVAVAGRELRIENVDVLDGTPLLDIKPYIPEADAHTVARVGWLEPARGQFGVKRSDDRFR
jgi:tRNA-Thr(GGU) m(6)t(6)A37 methyltransferase TsaA